MTLQETINSVDTIDLLHKPHMRSNLEDTDETLLFFCNIVLNDVF